MPDFVKENEGTYQEPIVPQVEEEERKSLHQQLKEDKGTSCMRIYRMIHRDPCDLNLF